MTSQYTRGVPRLKFRHKIHEMWVIFSFVAIASQKFYRRVAKHHCCFISHGATPGADDVTGQGDLAGWPYLYYRALGLANKQQTNVNKIHFHRIYYSHLTKCEEHLQNSPGGGGMSELVHGIIDAEAVRHARSTTIDDRLVSDPASFWIQFAMIAVHKCHNNACREIVIKYPTTNHEAGHPASKLSSRVKQCLFVRHASWHASRSLRTRQKQQRSTVLWEHVCFQP